MHDVVIHHNTADKGAGIFFDGGTDADDLVLDRVLIEDNFANDAGGGVRIQGHVQMTMSAGSKINENTANPANTSDGFGGGLQMLDTASATILGEINFNKARFGGGIAAHDNSVVRIIGIAPDQPSIVSADDALVAGGGI